MLGRIMRTTLNREDVVLATKAGFGVRDGHQVIDTSRKAMLNDLAGSLRRLRTDHVDLWQVHAWSDTPLDETLAALDQAVRSGMARYVGCAITSAGRSALPPHGRRPSPTAIGWSAPRWSIHCWPVGRRSRWSPP